MSSKCDDCHIAYIDLDKISGRILNVFSSHLTYLTSSDKYYLHLFKYCPECGHKIDRDKLNET